MDEVSIDQIKQSPYQPRIYFELESLKESLRQDGMLIVPVVREKPDERTRYEIIDGERRWRAVKELGWKKIPVEIKNVDDETARRMVYTLNEERQPYTLEENTKFFWRMYEQMKTVYAVAQAFSKPQQTIWRYINISMLPEHLQKSVWVGKITTGFIQELEIMFTEARDEIGDITHYSEYQKSPTYQRIVALCERIYTGEIQSREELRKNYVDPYLESLDKKRVERVKEEVEKVVPEHLIEAKEVKLETPEELERAAIVLRKEARKRREGALTPEEKTRIEAEKKKKKEEKRRKLEERKKREEEERRKREESERQRLEEEMKQKLEEERKRLEEEVKANAKDELLKDREFIKEFIAKEYPLIHETLDVEDLRELLMQRLMTNIPEEKKERAEEIFKEEWGSLEKRINIFPEKSAKIEPKFEYLRLMEERGVIPYTVWDFQYRDDYAGDKDFHGNCSPQVVEQCIWRLTNEGDLVLDPMAGSGTVIGVCKRYNRKCIGYDIKPPPNRTDIIQNDSRKIPLNDESVDMIFIHPPYWNLAYFTKAEERLSDLSRAKSSEEFLDMLKQVFQECYRTLKHGKFMCVLLGDVIREGRFIPLCRKATNMAEEIGFLDYGCAVKLAHGEVSRKKSGVIVAEPIYTDNLKISHDLVMFFRRD